MEQLRLKPEVKVKWLEALRSGHYDQGSGWLRGEDNTFCCLGVLCDVYDKQVVANGGKSEWKHSTWSSIRKGFIESNFTAVPPDEVMEWATENYLQPDGKTLGPSFDYSGGDNCLTSDNDNGKSFNEIANIIEKEF